MAQQRVPCVVYRGGTSRGLFFYRKDLPEDWEAMKHIFLTGLDAYNLSQVDGLGGTASSTSKAVIMAPSEREDADVDYTFIQIGVGEPLADPKGTCGNLMAATALFAIDEGLVAFRPDEREGLVRVWDTNTKNILNITVPLEGGIAAIKGGYHMPGVVQPGPKIKVSIMNPGGGRTGKTLTLGTVSEVTTQDGTYAVTFADIVNPLVFMEAGDVGLTGTEPSSAVAADEALIWRVRRIRDTVAVQLGFASSLATAHEESPALPRIVMVAPPQDYVTTSGEKIKAEDTDVLVKVLSMGKLHRTSPASGLYCIAAACLLPGTIANKVARKKEGIKDQVIRIAHPDGVVDVNVSLTDDGSDVLCVGTDRTARRIMKGELFVPEV